MAKVIPLYKKGDQQCMDNNRYVSVLSEFLEIIEKVFLSQLPTVFNKNKIISGSQHGFRPQQSIGTATSNLINHVLNVVDNNRKISGLFLDLMKVFDVTDHSVLLGDPERYGVIGVPNKCIKSYLKYQSQGSILGQFLFLVYINDCLSHIRDSEPVKIKKCSTTSNKYR
ncbi:uncharacterized protein LOC126129286 [Schistocerca cancellata]|uniref:uncharacterized protein LOC126129286 n=1 Tax=Schistocerca cancellata TaxID=274614 RepID=UPI0021175C23|nr:uncharacterized protein LOC126129286 [Schistocerca cancellata]